LINLSTTKQILKTGSNFWIIFLSVTLLSCSEKNKAIAHHSNCKVAIESADGDVKFIDAPSLDISKGTNFKLPTSLHDASSILCDRPNMVLKTTDFLVVMEGRKPLMLTGTKAKVVLEMVKGQFRMRVIDGKLSEQQIETAQNAMNTAQSIHQGE